MHHEFCSGKETLGMNGAGPGSSVSAFPPHGPGTWQGKPAEAQHVVMSPRASQVHLIPVSLGTGAQAWRPPPGSVPGAGSAEEERGRQCVTCGAPLKPRAVGGHQRRVPRLSRLPDAHFEGTSNHVAPIELDVDRVDAVLVGDEANRVLIWESEQKHRVRAGPTEAARTQDRKQPHAANFKSFMRQRFS